MENIVENLFNTVEPNHLEVIFKAIQFACEKHRDQKRKDKFGTPYIIHPIRVASNVITIGKITDYVIVCAAILHDTIEDTDTTYEELVEVFGTEIADVVRECTDDKTMDKQERKIRQVINATKKSPKARIVKLCDKLDNLTDIRTNPPQGWSESRINQYLSWARQVTDQICDCNLNLKNALEKVYNME